MMRANGGWRWPLLLALQMLPATMLTPAVRPLFAAHHGGREGAMHAFFSLAMVGAILATPFVVRRRPPIRALVLLDLALLVLVASPLPLPLVLLLRALEGGAHVGATTCLMAAAAEHARVHRCARTVPASAAAVSLAVALGSAFGGLVVHLGGPSATFGVAAVLLGVVAALAPPAAPRPTVEAVAPRLDPHVFATAFLGRFFVGCLVVTFALFAHRVHRLGDGAVGALFAGVTVPFALATYPLGRFAAQVGGADRLATLGASASGLALAALGFVPTSLLPVPLVAFGLGGAALFASAVERSARGHGDRGKAMGALQAAGCAGMLAGPIVAGIVSALTRTAHDPARAPRAVFLLGAAIGATFAVHAWSRARVGTALAVSPEKWRSSPRIGSR